MSVQFPSSPETRWSANGQARTRQWMCCQYGRRNVYSPWASACTELLANIPEFRRRYDCFHDRCMRCVWKWSFMDDESEDEGYESSEAPSKEPVLLDRGQDFMAPMLINMATRPSDTSGTSPLVSSSSVVHNEGASDSTFDPTLEAVQQHIFDCLMQREEERRSHQKGQHRRNSITNTSNSYHRNSNNGSGNSNSSSSSSSSNSSTIDHQDDHHAASNNANTNASAETSPSGSDANNARDHHLSMSYAEAAASVIRRKLSLSIPTSVAAAAGAAVAVAAAAVAGGSGLTRRGKRGSRHPSRSIGGAWFA
ncbi:hypothetical protein VTJ83DRAFT_5717 [Remersonia thermophila]|uniref:Uncharacterized protein n=1 Tax=Remersonia thermophila TaxID=72144 RepID=A0ABR4D7M0_9PEZI